MTDINIPQIRVIKDAWVYHFGRNNWEFHGPRSPLGRSYKAAGK